MKTEQEQRFEWVSKLEDAQGLLREAYELIDEYCRESGDRNTEAYIADHLRIMIDGDHGFISRDRNLGDVIDELLHPDDDEGNEDEVREYANYLDDDDEFDR